jgi:hypothetical protein
LCTAVEKRFQKAGSRTPAMVCRRSCEVRVRLEVSRFVGPKRK